MYIYKLIKHPIGAYLLTLLLVFISGNPWFKMYGEYVYVIIAGIICIDLLISPIAINLYNQLWKYIALMLGIFLIQFITLGWNTIPGIINFIAKIFLGGVIFILMGYRFKYYYMKVLYHLSIIAIIFWSLQVFAGITFDLLELKGYGKSILFYFSRHNEPLRNSGAFWEPGAYGCYLMLIPLFFVNKFPTLWKHFKKECCVLFIALLTTQSTTTYISFGIFILLYICLQMKSLTRYFYLICIIAFFSFIYISTPFLSEKINYQNELAVDAKGKFSASRTGTLLFDLHYIKKHPIFGNGLHEKTRYVDHYYLVKLWENGKLPKGGNGFSDYLAKMGITFYICFIYFFIQTNKQLKIRERILFFIIFCCLLMGEPLFSYPIALALPFVQLCQKSRYKIYNYYSFHSQLQKQKRVSA